MAKAYERAYSPGSEPPKYLCNFEALNLGSKGTLCTSGCSWDSSSKDAFSASSGTWITSGGAQGRLVGLQGQGRGIVRRDAATTQLDQKKAPAGGGGCDVVGDTTAASLAIDRSHVLWSPAKGDPAGEESPERNAQKGVSFRLGG
ncbi:hypothetical protein GUJ93_ZPchr0004g40171 [Zizania palustris]|uniref:Uncharacterized protein n=1 Tax=Zizania palustris TaxID=103762 RepID=A0A8J5T173_ZIZPA|nr:hypothetical protein GUJ93_ZPchr0004g40171 [Zizania palustris]